MIRPQRALRMCGNAARHMYKTVSRFDVKMLCQSCRDDSASVPLLRRDILLPGKITWKYFQYSLVPFQLIALNFEDPGGKSLFEVASSSPRLQVTFPPARVLHAQTTLIVDQPQRAPISGGTHLSLVVLLQAVSQI